MIYQNKKTIKNLINKLTYPKYTFLHLQKMLKQNKPDFSKSVLAPKRSKLAILIQFLFRHSLGN